MESERAIGRNEALFREVNERIREITAVQGVPTDERVLFQCECGRLDCHEQIELSVAEYEAVRAQEHQFLARPGHQIEAVETVVLETDRYIVVRKHGKAAEATEQV
jgi:hypothetical protein